MAVVSGLTVFGAPQEGLNAVRETLVGYRHETEAVLALTEPTAIVVVDRADKYLFPKRTVIYPLRAESTYEILPQALVNRPTYYYGLTLPEGDLAWLRTVKLAPSGLTIDLVADLGENSLYVFRPLDTEVENSYGNASSETP
jgi:hypothetical protein